MTNGYFGLCFYPKRLDWISPSMFLTKVHHAIWRVSEDVSRALFAVTK